MERGGGFIPRLQTLYVMNLFLRVAGVSMVGTGGKQDEGLNCSWGQDHGQSHSPARQESATGDIRVTCLSFLHHHLLPRLFRVSTVCGLPRHAPGDSPHTEPWITLCHIYVGSPQSGPELFTLLASVLCEGPSV